jgi:hypothetical protein
VTDDHAMKPGANGRPAKADAVPFPDSVCHRCANSRVIATRTSTFLLCTVVAVKYPRQPVSDCAEFKLAERRR